MIFIERPPAPGFLIDEQGKWVKEIKDAIKHYKNNPTKPFKFSHYNDKRVKEELEKIFTKCAYCESTYQSSSDGDIEHFRPKGSIIEIKRKPGYYWLANDWDNLLLSCQHCNQKRIHKIYDSKKKESLGKKDQFPLKKEKYRMSKPSDSFKAEEKDRLLINPCVENPINHFIYHDLEPVMIPETDRGEISIEVYALRRRKLIIERKKIRIHLFHQMDQTKLTLEIWNSETDKKKKKNLKKAYTGAYELMLQFAQADRQYAGMCRFYIKEFLKENDLI